MTPDKEKLWICTQPRAESRPGFPDIRKTNHLARVVPALLVIPVKRSSWLPRFQLARCSLGKLRYSWAATESSAGGLVRLAIF